jgi:choline dehydrogenase
MGGEADKPLDEMLRVRGVDNLRVADASALPQIPRANTNAPSIMIGERCADFLLEGVDAITLKRRCRPFPTATAETRSRS